MLEEDEAVSLADLLLPRHLHFNALRCLLPHPAALLRLAATIRASIAPLAAGSSASAGPLSDWFWPEVDWQCLQARFSTLPAVSELAAGITPEHLVDDFALSNNIARFGLKFTTLMQLWRDHGLVKPDLFHHDTRHCQRMQYIRLARFSAHVLMCFHRHFEGVA